MKNNIKKLHIQMISIIVSLLVVISPTSVIATTTPSVSAGIKPSNIFYYLDLLGEKISLFFTRDPYEKAKKLLLNADERIAEIKASEDNQKSATKAVGEFTKDISRALESFDNIKEDSKKAGFLISFSNRYKEYGETLISLLSSWPEDEKPILGEKIDVYLEKVEIANDAVRILVSKKELSETSNKSNSQNVTD